MINICCRQNVASALLFSPHSYILHKICNNTSTKLPTSIKLLQRRQDFDQTSHYHPMRILFGVAELPKCPVYIFLKILLCGNFHWKFVTLGCKLTLLRNWGWNLIINAYRFRTNSRAKTELEQALHPLIYSAMKYAFYVVFKLVPIGKFFWLKETAKYKSRKNFMVKFLITKCCLLKCLF